jgi:regulator of nonsense transcripts 2
VDVACALLETCGRFLVRNPDTASRMNAMLDIFLRLKSAKSLDGRQAVAVEAAHFACRPPDHPVHRKAGAGQMLMLLTH